MEGIIIIGIIAIGIYLYHSRKQRVQELENKFVQQRQGRNQNHFKGEYFEVIPMVLFNALKYSYNLTDYGAAKLLKNIPIIDAHGKVGIFEYEVENPQDHTITNSYGTHVGNLINNEERFLN